MASSRPAVIAVLNDDPDACEMLARILELDGHRVERTGNAEAIPGTIRDIGAVLVVLDLVVGGFGANLDALERIRNWPDETVQATKVVLVAASHSQALFSWQSGIDGILVRPFHADDLRAEVRSALKRRERDRIPHRRRAQRALLR